MFSLIRWSLYLIILITAACNPVGPDYIKPDTSTLIPDAWRQSGYTAETAGDLAEWWRNFEDPALNRLIDKAIIGSYDLKIAEARVREAFATRRATDGTLFPSVSASSEANRTQSQASSSQSRVTDQYSLGLGASWEIDIFGGVRRSIEAAQADIEATQEDLRNVAASLTAEVALYYVQYRSLSDRIDIAKSNLETRIKTLELIESRHKAGLIGDMELQSAIENVESARAQIPALETNQISAKHHLTTLLGLTPGSLDDELAEGSGLPRAPVRMAVGIPAEAIRRRPDIRSAERQLAAETARIGVATAELYPKFSLDGTIGFESLSASGLFSSGSDVFSIGPGATWNLFQAGSIREKIKAQEASQEQALLTYEQSILSALEEVEVALTALAKEQIHEQALSRAETASVQAAMIARSNYKDGGITSFLDVLDAERSRLSSEDALATSRADILLNFIQLYRVLGGGWK